MKLIIEVTICLLPFLNFALASEESPANLVAHNGDQKLLPPKSLAHLGVADGTSYFYDNEVRLNWTSAETYCQSIGMQMGSITTQGQFDLMSNLQGTVTEKRFWTGGREAQNFRMFTWDAIPGSDLTADALTGFDGLDRGRFTICMLVDTWISPVVLALEECYYNLPVVCEIP